ncbi:Muc22p [Pestalotiopsis sp. 9143b]|nr:Muc22p [Pestalotiopsis sp. 9143b]
MPTATADVSNNLVQPNSSGGTDDAGALVVTPSQIAAIVIGTIVGTAIFTLLVVYGVMLCRQKREKKYLEGLRRGGNKDHDHITLTAMDHDDETGRAEGYSSRDEKQRAKWFAQTRPDRAHHIPSSTQQKGPLTSHRPSLPPLPEESPRVSDQFNLYPPEERDPNGLDFHPMTYASEQTPGMPEEPAPVKLSLMKRRSKGGSQRIAVARVGSTSTHGPIRPSRNSTVVNPYFTGPAAQVSSRYHRPPLDRTPSSDTLPRGRGDRVSPLALNPTTVSRSASDFTWGSWGPETPSRPPPVPSINVPTQPDYPYSPYGNLASKPQYAPDSGQDTIGFLLQQQQQGSATSLPQRAQPGYNSQTANGGLGAANQISSDYLSTPQPTRPYNHLSGISGGSPYSSTFEVPLASPAYMSPLSPPPKSPLRTVVRLTKSDRELRDQHNVSPLSSDGAEPSTNTNTNRRSGAPQPLRRLSRSSGELGAVGLAQATAGLDLNIGGFNIAEVMSSSDPAPASQTDTTTTTATTATTGVGSSSGRLSRASSLRSTNTTNTNLNGGGGRFTFLSSSGHTPDSRRSLTPTSPWGGPPASIVPPPLRKRRSSSLGRIEIPPEQLTAGGIYVGAPGPRFTLFPRTDGGNAPRPVVPVAAAPLSPSGLSHGKSRSTGNAEYEHGLDERAGFGLAIR